MVHHANIGTTKQKRTLTIFWVNSWISNDMFMGKRKWTTSGFWQRRKSIESKRVRVFALAAERWTFTSMISAFSCWNTYYMPCSFLFVVSVYKRTLSLLAQLTSIEYTDHCHSRPGGFGTLLRSTLNNLYIYPCSCCHHHNLLHHHFQLFKPENSSAPPRSPPWCSPPPPPCACVPPPLSTLLDPLPTCNWPSNTAAAVAWCTYGRQGVQLNISGFGKANDFHHCFGEGKGLPRV